MLTIALKLLLSIACGAIIGLEREIKEKAAGLRTHILVCLGSGLFGMLGLEIVTQFPGADILRLAQGILIGIGFLGAGVITREGISTKGLTTAAGIWVLGAIGLAIGLGFYRIALMGTLFSFFVVSLFGSIEKLLKK